MIEIPVRQQSRHICNRVILAQTYLGDRFKTSSTGSHVPLQRYRHLAWSGRKLTVWSQNSMGSSNKDVWAL